MTTSTSDWDFGNYEHTAAQLEPASEVVVGEAAPRAGECVVDIGCGTGNAALLAAARLAEVIGVDPAPRLLEVARRRVAARGLKATFVQGHAAALPIPSGRADALLSVFGVIYAPDAHAAASEISRVAKPDARVVLSAWIPSGAIAEVNRRARSAVADALGTESAPPPLAWHDRTVLAELFAAHGFDVGLDEHPLAFTADSAPSYLDAELDNHPFLRAGRQLFEPPGRLAPLREQLVAILEDANENPAAFCVTSRYIVATATRGRSAARCDAAATDAGRR